jgi:hypothetical protein
MKRRKSIASAVDVESWDTMHPKTVGRERKTRIRRDIVKST